MQVVRTPELDQIRPRLVAILLRTDPSVLFVTRKNKIVRKLRAHKTLVIIGCGVDQMSEDLDRRPIIISDFAPALFRRDVPQPRGCTHDRLAKISEKLVKAIWSGHGDWIIAQPREFRKLCVRRDTQRTDWNGLIRMFVLGACGRSPEFKSPPKQTGSRRRCIPNPE